MSKWQNLMNNYSAYLFDLDGTLVQSEKLKGLAISKACYHFGCNVDPIIYKEIMGESWEVVSQYFFTAGGIQPKLSEFDKVFKKIYEKLIHDELELSPNAKRLLTKLFSRGKKIGLVSSASHWMVDQILGQFEIKDFFEVLITREEVLKHKPHPEAYLLALEKLSLKGSDVLVFEDSYPGLVAANKASCQSVAFRHEINTMNDLSLAVKIITDFAEIKI